MRLIDKTTVPQGYSVSKFLDQKGYRLFVDDSIYTIMVMDGNRYIFEMENDIYGVINEFKNEIEKVAKK